MGDGPCVCSETLQGLMSCVKGFVQEYQDGHEVPLSTICIVQIVCDEHVWHIDFTYQYRPKIVLDVSFQRYCCVMNIVLLKNFASGPESIKLNNKIILDRKLICLCMYQEIDCVQEKLLTARMFEEQYFILITRYLKLARRPKTCTQLQ